MWILATALFCAAPQGDAPARDLRERLASHSEATKHVLDNAELYRLQILLAEPVEQDDRLVLRRTRLGTAARYFYPASSVKTCAAVAALIDLNRINAETGGTFGVESFLNISSRFAGDKQQTADGGRPITFGHEIRKLFLVSDNVAYNRLYEFVGHRELNEAMHAAGLSSCRIFHRLSEFRSVEEQRQTRRTAISADGENWIKRQARDSDLLHDNADLTGIEIGEAHFSRGEKVMKPLSFRYKNSISLEDLQDMQVELVRPEIDTGKRGFPELSSAQRDFIRAAMSQYPSKSESPKYDAADYPDDYVKYLLPGVARVIPKERIRIYNKVGRAYGFTTENAYVEDLATGRGFFLAAVLYTNPNRTLNDDDYAYDEVADPFLADLGEVVARMLWQ